MQFQRFRSRAPARMTRNEESPGWTHLHHSQLLPSLAIENIPSGVSPTILHYIHVILHQNT